MRRKPKIGSIWTLKTSLNNSVSILLVYNNYISYDWYHNGSKIAIGTGVRTIESFYKYFYEV